MNKGFWQGIVGVMAVAVVGVVAWQFISLHERVGTLEDEMNVLPVSYTHLTLPTIA